MKITPQCIVALTWTLKDTLGEILDELDDPVDMPLIEHATMTLCGKAGITVAETRLVPLAGENAIAVRRFDRKGAQRVHCISAGTALRALVTAPPGT